VTPPPRESLRRPVRIEPVSGSPYGLVIVGGPPVTSGPAIGALVAGIAALLVSLLVACFGLAEAAAPMEDAPGGWGALVGGAFAVLTGFLGLAAIGLGVVGMRQTDPRRRPIHGAVAGRGLAVAGLACGAAGLALAACALGGAVLVALG
jgi:hypothetical protein